MVTIVEVPPEVVALSRPENVFLLPARSEQSLRDLVEAWRIHDFVRVVRGSRMRTISGLFDEFAAAFQFPVYFGQNLDAFLESLSEPVQEPVVDGRVCIIWEAEQLLIDEPVGSLNVIVPVFIAARENWASARGGVTSRLVPRAFSIVLAPLSEEKRVQRDWQLTGAQVIRLKF